jgi:Family of unknown function (DUF6512)
MNRKLLYWEIGSFVFIGLVGAALHFTFEFSNFSNMVVAYFSAVNESTWEHLKMVFFPGIFFALVEYTYVRDVVRNYLIAKTASVFIMPLVITLGWYAYTPFTGRSIYKLDLVLFYLAVTIGQIVSYKILTAPQMSERTNKFASVSLVLMFVAFSTFTFFPPKIFLFEHFDLKDTGLYGILDSYEGLRYFTKPSK